MSLFKKILRIAAAVIILAGLCILLYPRFTNWRYQRSVSRMRDEFTASGLGSAWDSVRQDELKEIPCLDLLQAMQQYNAELETNGQAELTDTYSYREASFDLAEWGVEDNIIGYLDIPAMDVTLPIYLGANEATLKAGAAQLSETSLPIGSFQGVSTNCVIAAHRGYGKADMFRNIERLQVGDQMTITNLWETLTYEVVEIKVITPYEIDQVLIQEGRDMLTLSTCHPYRHNYQRYIVYCERVLEEDSLVLHADELGLFEP